MKTFHRLSFLSFLFCYAHSLWAIELTTPSLTAKQHILGNHDRMFNHDHDHDAIHTLMTRLSGHDPYSIDNIKVDVTSTSASDARNIAIQEAQRQAFSQLFNKIVLNPPLTSENITDNDIEFMVQDFEITHEKITSVRYVADFKIKFNKNAVENILTRHNISLVTEVQELQDIVIIPLLDENNSMQLWNENNLWFQAWSQGSKEITDYNITVPIGDLTDIKDLSIADISDGNIQKIAQFIKRYDVHHGLVALLKLNELKDQPHHHILELMLYSQDNLLASIETTVEPSSVEKKVFFKHLVQKSCELLPQLQSEMNTIKTHHKLNFIVPFTSLKQWIKIRKFFENKSLFKNLNILSLNQHQVEINVTCINSLNRMSNYLKLHGFEVQQLAPQHYKLVTKTDVHVENNSLQSASDKSALIKQHTIEKEVSHYKNLSDGVDSMSSSVSSSQQRITPYFMPSELD